MLKASINGGMKWLLNVRCCLGVALGGRGRGVRRVK